MYITNISPQKRKKDRVNIFIDEKFAFSLDLETLIKERLEINQEIDSEKIAELIKKGDYQKLCDKVMRFISLRPRSEKEIIDYLKKKEAGEKEISMVVKKLIGMGLVDDYQFAAWWFEQRENFRPKSLLAIKSELFQKGIKREIIEKISEGRQNLDIEMANKIALKALKRYRNLPRVKIQQKLSNYLVQRGFSFETSKKVIDSLLKRE